MEWNIKITTEYRILKRETADINGNIYYKYFPMSKSKKEITIFGHTFTFGNWLYYDYQRGCIDAKYEHQIYTGGVSYQLYFLDEEKARSFIDGRKHKDQDTIIDL